MYKYNLDIYIIQNIYNNIHIYDTYIVYMIVEEEELI